MILIDTSVLVDYFKGIESRPAKLFDELMEMAFPMVSIILYIKNYYKDREQLMNSIHSKNI